MKLVRNISESRYIRSDEMRRRFPENYELRKMLQGKAHINLR